MEGDGGDVTGRSEVGQIWRCDVTHARVGPADQSQAGWGSWWGGWGCVSVSAADKLAQPQQQTEILRGRAATFTVLTPPLIPCSPPLSSSSTRRSLLTAKEDVCAALWCSFDCEHKTLPFPPGSSAACVRACVSHMSYSSFCSLRGGVFVYLTRFR